MKKRTPSEIAKHFSCYVTIPTNTTICCLHTKEPTQRPGESCNGHIGSWFGDINSDTHINTELLVEIPNWWRWDRGYWNPKGEFVEVGE